MIAAVPVFLLFTSLVSTAPARSESAAAPDSARPAAADSAAPRIVRRFPAIEVRATLRDMSSSQTVHAIPGPSLQNLPVDGLVEAIALQPGVVAQAGELHVRGGRTGQTLEYLDGIPVSEPLRRRAMELPLFAVRDVELVTGAPEAGIGCGLAGALLLHTVDPSPRLGADARWATDFHLSEQYDRASGRLNVPLGRIGIVGAADGTLDGTWYPKLRTPTSFDLAGLSISRRSEDLLQAWAKVAPLARPERLSAQVLVSRQVHQPYDPAWSMDGWSAWAGTRTPGAVFSPDPQPGYQRYVAADHLAITDERRTAAVLSSATRWGSLRASAALGWLRTSTVTSVSGSREDLSNSHGVLYAPALPGADPFHVLLGSDPLYRESESDLVSLRGDLERAGRSGNRIAAGAGATVEDVSLREMDWSLAMTPLFGFLDNLREYHARAPGGYGYAQGRWVSGGLVLNGGLRAEYWTPGPEGRLQTLPWDGKGAVLVSPRLGIAVPMSVNDAVSFSYARLSQAPPRDFLYDHRQAITNRQPLGNPALRPETSISYEAALQHLFSREWAAQGAVFYRDLYDQIGARDYATPGLPTELRYDNSGNGHVVGFEWSLAWSSGAARAGAQYTWMDARGYESRPEGDAFGAIRSARIAPIGDVPLSWDRRHTVALSAFVPWKDRWEFSWSTQVGSPLPWTPHALTDTLPDPQTINSGRLGWTECTNVNVRWKPLATRGLAFACEVRNLFDTRGEIAATVDGYPNPLVNTRWDEYGAYRTATGRSGGGYWVDLGGGNGTWVPVHDPRLFDPPRSIRMSFSTVW